jgi:hypothetical protein
LPAVCQRHLRSQSSVSISHHQPASVVVVARSPAQPRRTPLTRIRTLSTHSAPVSGALRQYLILYLCMVHGGTSRHLHLWHLLTHSLVSGMALSGSVVWLYKRRTTYCTAHSQVRLGRAPDHIGPTITDHRSSGSGSGATSPANTALRNSPSASCVISPLKTHFSSLWVGVGVGVGVGVRVSP